jgi:EAL domain-containing protein (putative c-di-GMP-specific phosphodiesterase class I)
MGVLPWQKGISPGEQFEHAWSACNMTRKGYHNRLKVYNQKMREKELQEQRLLNDLHRAVEDHQFEVFYQPKYNVQGSVPRLCSAEALLRWRHPELGMIPPDQFVPLFEREGQITLVDHYVWREVAKQIAHWRDQYGVIVPISVNLSRLDVFDPELENVLDDLMQKNGLERNVIKLEVSESAYADNAEHLVQLVDRLRKKGYEIEMDDFGTGYSSLNMLSSMPVDVLKMNKAFIKNIGSDEKGIHFVQMIVDIAKTLNVPVVAEGVETESQMLLLKELGCSLVQGFYFSHPMPPEDFGKTILSAAS